MTESLTFFLVAIPATCVFWFLYAIIVTELANWKTWRRLRNYKGERSSDGVSRVPPQKKPPSKVTRGFDSPEVFSDDALKRIHALQKRIGELDRELDSWKSNE
jgi:hypothetical protein